MHSVARLRKQFAAREITEVAFRAALYCIGYAPGEVQREVEEHQPNWESLGAITERLLERLKP